MPELEPIKELEDEQYLKELMLSMEKYIGLEALEYYLEIRKIASGWEGLDDKAKEIKIEEIFNKYIDHGSEYELGIKHNDKLNIIEKMQNKLLKTEERFQLLIKENEIYGAVKGFIRDSMQNMEKEKEKKEMQTKEEPPRKIGGFFAIIKNALKVLVGTIKNVFGLGKTHEEIQETDNHFLKQAHNIEDVSGDALITEEEKLAEESKAIVNKKERILGNKEKKKMLPKFLSNKSTSKQKKRKQKKKRWTNPFNKSS